MDFFKFESPIVLSPEALSKTMVTKDPFRFDGPASFTLQIDSSNIVTDNKELLFSIFFTKNKPTDFGASAGRCGWADISTKGEIGEGIAIDSTNKVKVVDNNYIKDFLLDHVYPQNTEILVQNQHDEVRTNFSMTFIGRPDCVRQWLSSQPDLYGQTYYNNTIFSDFVITEPDAKLISVRDIETNDYRDITTYKSPVLFQLGDDIGYRMYDFVIPAIDGNGEGTVVDIFNLNHLTLRLLFEAKGTKFSLSALRDGDISYQKCLNAINVGPFDFARLGIGQFSPLYNYGEEYKANFLLHNVHISSSTPKFIYDVQQGLTSILGEGNFLIDYNNAPPVLTITLPYALTDEQRAEIEYLFKRAVPSNITVEYDPFPLDYTQLAFLQSTGTQYIDTGYRDPVYLQMKYACLSTTRQWDRGANGWGMIPWMSGGIAAAFANVASQGPSFAFYVASAGNSIPIEFGKAYEVEHDQYDNHDGTLSARAVSFAIDGSKVVMLTEKTATSFLNHSRVRNYCLFDYNSSGYKVSERVWYAKMTRSGQLMRDYVPAISSEGKPCMFDLISKTPYYNSRSGSIDFIAGISTISQLVQLSNNLPVATPVYDSSGVQTGPIITLSLSSVFANSECLSIAIDRITSKNWIIAIREWTDGLIAIYESADGLTKEERPVVPASFLESNGAQYINTGFKATGTTRAEIKSVVLSIPAHYQCFFGAGHRSGQSSTNQGYFTVKFGQLYDGVTNDNWVCAYAKQSLDDFKQTVLGQTYHVILDSNILTVNGSELATFEPAEFETQGNINLGVSYFSWQDKWLNNNQRIYMFKLSDNGTPKADYIPGVDPSGRTCFYDLVTKTAKYRADYHGSGEYIVGVETEYNLDAIIANLTTATPEYDTDGTTQIGPVIKISVPATWSVDISDGSTSFAKKMYDAAFEKKYILQFSQH